MPEFVRVKDKQTGHHYTVAAVDPAQHEVLKQDATDGRGNPLPAKAKKSVDQAAESKKPATGDLKGK